MFWIFIYNFNWKHKYYQNLRLFEDIWATYSSRWNQITSTPRYFISVSCGLYQTVFKCRSTHSASCSKIKRKVSWKEIRQTEHWRRNGILAKFYDKLILEPEQFTFSILDSRNGINFLKTMCPLWSLLLIQKMVSPS